MSSRLFALLVGVGDYAPNLFPDGDPCPDLPGAVGDVESVERFLRHRFRLPDEQVLKLTAAPGAPAGPAGTRPTYRNIVAAFQRVTDAAAPGDRLYIHYSGHGARTPTLFPELKGAGGWDECLAPCDICRPGTRYLRDVELGLLLHRMTDRGLSVTIVLDCCHSGGATRGWTEPVARGKADWDRTARPVESGLGDREELVESWLRIHGEGAGGPGWLPPAAGYVLLAACREHERARELPFDGGERHGVLTYWLLDILRRHGPDLTCRQLHGLLVARVHGRIPSQTPVLLGDGDRPFFGADGTESPHASGRSILVLRVDEENGWLLLNTGLSQGVRAGEQLAVFPPGAPVDRNELRQAFVEIRQAGATESWAEVVRELAPGPVEPGAQAVLTGASPLSLQRGVAVVGRMDGPATGEEERALEKVREALAGNPPGFVHLAADSGEIDLQVTLRDPGEYEILDRGGAPLGLPPLPVSLPSSVPKLLKRLQHLARYRIVEELANPQPHELLQGFELRIPDRPEPGVVELRHGESVRVEICNGSPWDLSLTVLDLRPDWSVAVVWPPSGGLSDHTLARGGSLTLPISPCGLFEGIDVLKVFATRGTASFDWLQMPALDAERPVRRGKPRGVLGQLFAMLGEEAPRQRKLYPSEFPEEEWITRQLTIRIVGGSSSRRSPRGNERGLTPAWETVQREVRVRR